jgi:hypothetical protein
MKLGLCLWIKTMERDCLSDLQNTEEDGINGDDVTKG